MRRVQGCLAVVVLLTAMPLFAQSKAKVQNVPEIPYDSVPNALKLPDNLYLGEGIGVATNSKGHVFVYTRSARTRLFEFDQNGMFLKEIGQDLYGFLFAHAVRVDKDDNIWAVDEGTNMVIKFDPNGKVLMTIGRRPEAVEGLEAGPPPGTPPPNAQPYALGRPTDIGWDAQGNIFISDGYTNSRVVKYDKFGKFIKSVGTRGTAPGQMNTPHGLQVDLKGNVYVADRGNARIQVFDNNLILRAIYDHVGNPWTLCITPGPRARCPATSWWRTGTACRGSSVPVRPTRTRPTGCRRSGSSPSSSGRCRAPARARCRGRRRRRCPGSRWRSSAAC